MLAYFKNVYLLSEVIAVFQFQWVSINIVKKLEQYYVHSSWINSII